MKILLAIIIFVLLLATIVLVILHVRIKRAHKELIKSKAELKEALEKAAESDKLKSQFIINMGNEIREPLNTIEGFSEIMRDSDSREERAEYCEAINKSGQHLTKLIDDILNLSKIEAGEFAFNNVDFELVGAMNSLVNTFKERITEEHPDKLNIKINLNSPYKTCMVNFDMERAIIVMNALLSNAIKFTEEGEINVSFKEFEGGIKFEVNDTGIGIPQDKLEEIFGRFVKLNEFAPGSGLGLCIARAILNAKNGKIWAESTLGKGSSIFVWVPTPVKAS